MQFTCPECKNEVDTAVYPNLAVNQVVECGTCGITLLVTAIENGVVSSDISDEGK